MRTSIVFVSFSICKEWWRCKAVTEDQSLFHFKSCLQKVIIYLFFIVIAPRNWEFQGHHILSILYGGWGQNGIPIAHYGILSLLYGYKIALWSCFFKHQLIGYWKPSGLWDHKRTIKTIAFSVFGKVWKLQLLQCTILQLFFLPIKQIRYMPVTLFSFFGVSIVSFSALFDGAVL